MSSQTSRPPRPSAGDARLTSGSDRNQRRRNPSSQERQEARKARIEKARGEIVQALAISGLWEQRKGTTSIYVPCPFEGCHSGDPKAKLYPDGVTCMKCRRPANGVDVLVEHSKESFSDAVNLLTGGKTADGRTAPEKVDVTITRFESTADQELFQLLIQMSDLPAAQQFYAQWGISAQAVAEIGARRLTNPAAFKKAALALPDGYDRMVACGMMTDKGTVLVNSRYPIVEPHVWTDGRIASMQFRASEKTAEKVAAHKAEPEHNDYVAKFLSLRGVPTSRQFGFGLYRVGRLPAGSTVLLVEGAKDVAAARTLGREAYGLPGAGTVPPPAALKLLAKHRVVVAFDADDAGIEFRDRVVEQLRNAGAENVDVHWPSCIVGCRCQGREPDGKDVTDVLQDAIEAGVLEQITSGHRVTALYAA